MSLSAAMNVVTYVHLKLQCSELCAQGVALCERIPNMEVCVCLACEDNV